MSGYECDNQKRIFITNSNNKKTIFVTTLMICMSFIRNDISRLPLVWYIQDFSVKSTSKANKVLCEDILEARCEEKLLVYILNEIIIVISSLILIIINEDVKEVKLREIVKCIRGWKRLLLIPFLRHEKRGNTAIVTRFFDLCLLFFSN